MGGKKDDITIIVAFIQEKVFRKSSLEKKIFKNETIYNYTKTIKQAAPPESISRTDEYIKNFENLNLNKATEIRNNEDIIRLNKDEYLIDLNNNSNNNNPNNSFH